MTETQETQDQEKEAQAIQAEPTQAEVQAEEPQEEKKKLRKTRVGLVTSNKMDKTIVVTVERRLRHPIYGKYVKKSKKFVAHDENNDCNEGDTVRIIESRPLSKRKRWRLVDIVERVK